MARTIGTDVSLAARLLRDGKLVAFATETVYGLGANALDETAVAKVFAAKNRPRFDPLIVHLHERSQLDELVTEVNETAAKLIEQFWPGPLTLVLPKTERVPDLVTAGLPTVAVRMPDHPQTLELLRTADISVAAPSANPFGCVSPTTAEHVAEQLANEVDYILDGGPCRVGVESTVLFIPGEPGASATGVLRGLTPSGSPVPLLLRPGGVSVEEIEASIGPIMIRAATSDTDETAQPAPGMLTRHYAPRTPLEIHESVPDPGRNERVGLLSFGPQRDACGFAHTEILSSTADLTEAAAGFFAAVRRLDAQNLDRIIATPFPEQGLGRALNDRLRRAAT